MDARNQVKQYVDIAWRRKWWVLAPTVVGTLVGLYLYTSLPKIYRATTTILVTRQSVPEEIVRSTVTMRIDERMKSLKVQVLSRRYLEQVGREIGLIDDGADELKIQRACDQIEASVVLDWDKRDLSWIRIMAQDRDPKRAAKVANSLAEMFINQNTQFRTEQASGLVTQMDRWLKDSESELKQRDEEIKRFKQKYLYELPEQEGSALQLLNASQNRVAQLSSDIQLRSDRLSILRADEKTSRAQAAAAGLALPGDDPDSRALAKLEGELNELLISYTDENPLVRKKRDQIAQFKALHPMLTAAKAAPGGEPETSPEVKRLQAEIRNIESDRDREQARVEDLRHKLANMPLRAQELNDLTRDYDMKKKKYDMTVGQKDVAERSFDVESAKKGEQFLIQDRARPPAVPFSPVFVQMLLMGIAIGLGTGVGIAALLEFLDQSIRGEEQFVDVFPEIPILGSIPNLVAPTASPTKPRTPRSAKKASAGVVAVLAVLGGLLA